MPRFTDGNGNAIWKDPGEILPSSPTGSWISEGGVFVLPYSRVPSAQPNDIFGPLPASSMSDRAQVCLLAALFAGFVTFIVRLAMSKGPFYPLWMPTIAAAVVAWVGMYLLIISPRWIKWTLVGGVVACGLAVIVPVYQGRSIAQMLFETRPSITPEAAAANAKRLRDNQALAARVRAGNANKHRPAQKGPTE